MKGFCFDKNFETTSLIFLNFFYSSFLAVFDVFWYPVISYPNLEPRVLRLLGQRWGRRGELWGHGIFTAEIVRFRFLCACLGLIKRKSSRRFLFTMFEQAVSSSLHELGLVSLEKEQRQAVEAIVMKGRDVLTVLPTGFGKSLVILPSFGGYSRLEMWTERSS